MTNPTPSKPPPLLSGRVDVHSHLLPGLDDGCRNEQESLTCVRALMESGYVGTVCTPHVIPDLYPHINIENVADWVRFLQSRIDEAGLSFRLWAGGEVRLQKKLIDWMQAFGVPTLGDSKVVLVDLWEPKWPRYADRQIDWLLSNGYQPMLAHPERTAGSENFLRTIATLAGRGVWMQGNLRCFTGEEGDLSRTLAERLLEEGRYQMLALDLHRVDTLESRLAGLDLLNARLGAEALDRLVADQPRTLLGLESPSRSA
jgi:protein-tyrosine phosphatase